MLGPRFCFLGYGIGSLWTPTQNASEFAGCRDFQAVAYESLIVRRVVKFDPLFNQVNQRNPE
jgi:hypothetical protein